MKETVMEIQVKQSEITDIYLTKLPFTSCDIYIFINILMEKDKCLYYQHFSLNIFFFTHHVCPIVSSLYPSISLLLDEICKTLVPTPRHVCNLMKNNFLSMMVVLKITLTVTHNCNYKRIDIRTSEQYDKYQCKPPLDFRGNG